MSKDGTTADQAGLQNGDTLHIIGVFDDDEHATAAERALEEVGIPRDDISVIATAPPSASQPGARDTAVQKGVVAGLAGGAMIGGLVAVSLVIPGFGPLLAAGPFAAVLASLLGGTLVGGTLGGLAGALVSLGMTKEQAQEYEAMIRAGGEVVDVRIHQPSRLDDAIRIMSDHGAHHVTRMMLAPR